MVGCDQCVDPSLPYINRVFDLLLSHLTSFLYLFLVQTVSLLFLLSHLTSFFYLFLVQTVCFSSLVQFFFSLFLKLTSDMDSYPSTQSSKFVELLHRQQSISFGNYENSVSLSSSQPLFQRTLGTGDGLCLPNFLFNVLVMLKLCLL